MNDGKGKADGDYKSYLILEELSRGNPVTQRDLSKKLNVALGLVNSYIKNLVSKGYITVKAIPPKRYAYYLTPKGFAEKSRLTYEHLHNFTNLYRNARKEFKTLFNELYDRGIRKIVFCGVDEVADIAYLSLKEVDIELAGVIGGDGSDKKFFGHSVCSMKELCDINYDHIVVTSFLNEKKLYSELLNIGVPSEKIFLSGAQGMIPLRKKDKEKEG